MNIEAGYSYKMLATQPTSSGAINPKIGYTLTPKF
jgi:hypothetical protein